MLLFRGSGDLVFRGFGFRGLGFGGVVSIFKTP